MRARQLQRRRHPPSSPEGSSTVPHAAPAFRLGHRTAHTVTESKHHHTENPTSKIVSIQSDSTFWLLATQCHGGRAAAEFAEEGRARR